MKNRILTTTIILLIIIMSPVVVFAVSYDNGDSVAEDTIHKKTTTTYETIATTETLSTLDLTAVAADAVGMSSGLAYENRTNLEAEIQNRIKRLTVRIGELKSDAMNDEEVDRLQVLLKRLNDRLYDVHQAVPDNWNVISREAQNDISQVDEEM